MESNTELLKAEDLKNPVVKPSEKHFKITIVRSYADQPKPRTFIVTSEGLKGSLREPQEGKVNIGRQQVTEDGSRPNDIVLPPGDRAISRIHCSVFYKSFFGGNALPEEWVTFLMGYHPRLGRNSVLGMLSQDLFRYVLEFLREPKCLSLVDLGSLCGTYVKISNTEPIELESGQYLLVGSDITIEIERLACEPIPASINSEQTLEEFGQTINSSECNLEESLPFIHIKVNRNPNDHGETMHYISHKFIAEEKYKQFTIGRSQICDVQLPENTISRVQCRLVYQEGKWLLFDGATEKPTVNGTLVSICRKDRAAREHSAPYKLKNGNQFKVSESVLQVDWD